jgi:PAS domain S-box-containing protein
MPFTSGQPNILVIEDNSGDFLLIEDYLREEISEPVIHNSKTFAEAKEILASKIPFNAILLDLSLSDGSGEELVKEVIKISKNIPVIVLTGYSNKAFGIKTLSLGVSDYLLKDELTATQLFKSIAYSIERKKNTLKLKQSEEKYRNLFHLSPQPMWVFDNETFKFLSVNEAAIQHYGYSKEEFLAMTIKDIRAASDAKMVDEIVSTTKKNQAFYKGTFSHYKKNGDLIYVDIQSNTINFNGKMARLVLATDISERINQMQTIQERNLQLQEIAWIQSHIVRAPLARIMGLIDLIKNYSYDSNKISELLGYILTSSNELDEVIKGIVKRTEQVEAEKSSEQSSNQESEESSNIS